jgi:hypothetical protein
MAIAALMAMVITALNGRTRCGAPLIFPARVCDLRQSFMRPGWQLPVSVSILASSRANLSSTSALKAAVGYTHHQRLPAWCSTGRAHGRSFVFEVVHNG